MIELMAVLRDGHVHEPHECCNAVRSGDNYCFLKGEAVGGVSTYNLILDHCPISDAPTQALTALEWLQEYKSDQRIIDVDNSSFDIVRLLAVSIYNG